MKPILLILISCLCASAQIVPPMVQPPVVVQHKIPTPQKIIISWSTSISPYVTGYSITGSTNGVIFESTNVTGNSCELLTWPGTNVFQVEAFNSIAHSVPATLTHSGWCRDFQFALVILTNGIFCTNAFAIDTTNLIAPSFCRSVVDVEDAMFQMSHDLRSWTNLYSSDVDNFPVNFTPVVQREISTVNVP